MWVLGVVTAFAERSSAAADRRPPRPWQWAIVPTVFAVMTAWSVTDRYYTEPFDLAHPGLRQAAETALANPMVVPPAVTIAPYGSVTPEVFQGAVYFRLDSTLSTDDGWAYSPAGRPDYKGKCVHISGPWYRYSGPWVGW